MKTRILKLLSLLELYRQKHSVIHFFMLPFKMFT